MASPVGSSSQRRYSSAAQFSSGLATPGGTPPTNASSSNHLEARLHQLLANFDCGTHSFDRNERETPAEKRLSFGAADGMPVLPTPPGSRRPSFLSGLSLSRPSFGFSSTASSGTSTPTGTAPTTPINASQGHHHLPSGLKMTSTWAFNNSAIQDDELPVDPIRRPRSTPSGIPASGVQSQSVIGGDEAPSMAMHRSNTTPLSGQSGQFALQGNAGDRVFQAVRRSSVAVGEKRHFDPSKEPKLLGLL